MGRKTQLSITKSYNTNKMGWNHWTSFCEVLYFLSSSVFQWLSQGVIQHKPHVVSSALDKAKIWISLPELIEAFDATFILMHGFSLQIYSLYRYIKWWISWKKKCDVSFAIFTCLFLGAEYPYHINSHVHDDKYILCKHTHQWFDVIIDEFLGYIYLFLFLIFLIIEIHLYFNIDF